jgi:CheY-like chemotaxis protein
MQAKSKVILLAEDNVDDAEIFELMLKRATLPHTLHRVEDGQQAIEWLSGEGAFANREQFPLPDLLLLDLKMPRKNGFEVLEWVRGQKGFAELPVIVLSSSDDKMDVKRAYALGITTYFTKSADFQDVIQYLRLT